MSYSFPSIVRSYECAIIRPTCINWKKTRCPFNCTYFAKISVLKPKGTERLQALTDTLHLALRCHSNENRTPIANPPQIVHNYRAPLPFPSNLHPSPCSNVGMPRGPKDSQTDTKMAMTTIHFAFTTPHTKCNKCICRRSRNYSVTTHFRQSQDNEQGKWGKKTLPWLHSITFTEVATATALASSVWSLFTLNVYSAGAFWQMGKYHVIQKHLKYGYTTCCTVGGFKLRESGTPKFSALPSGETFHQTGKVFEVHECPRGRLSPCQVWRGLDFTCHRGGQKHWISFVCLFITLVNIRVCAPYFAMKALEYRNDYDTVG